MAFPYVGAQLLQLYIMPCISVIRICTLTMSPDLCQAFYMYTDYIIHIMMYLCWRATYVERTKCRANGKYCVQLFSSQNVLLLSAFYRDHLLWYKSWVGCIRRILGLT